MNNPVSISALIFLLALCSALHPPETAAQYTTEGIGENLKNKVCHAFGPNEAFCLNFFNFFKENNLHDLSVSMLNHTKAVAADIQKDINNTLVQASKPETKKRLEACAEDFAAAILKIADAVAFLLQKSYLKAVSPVLEAVKDAAACGEGFKGINNKSSSPVYQPLPPQASLSPEAPLPPETPLPPPPEQQPPSPEQQPPSPEQQPPSPDQQLPSPLGNKTEIFDTICHIVVAVITILVV